MPWKETCAMEQRQKFILAVSLDILTVSDACRQFGISRKTAYKWLGRFEDDGLAGLNERSRAPKHTPWALSEELRQRVIALRKQRPTWGPKKLLSRLATVDPSLALPAVSTVGDWLKRSGLVRPRRKVLRRRAVPTSLSQPHAANDCWSADFKGDFPLERRRCYPLTVTDNFSRFLLGCVALTSTATAEARPVFERLFLEYGLPSAIRTDNGPPFASTGLAGLSKLAVWWLRLGIRLERIPPGQPQHNGRHERMHRTLKAETLLPPAATLVGQQRRFDNWRVDFNTERPHEALGNDVPASVYQPSQRDMPRTLPDIEYPSHFLLRRIHTEGALKWRKRYVHLCDALKGEVVGLEETSDGVWAIHFASLQLGYLDERGEKSRIVALR